ncbi:MAG: hypothetical protein A2Z04_09240 [Chloroflexi bacterium RBG_16_57_9]|nr:MAG: hypothetical protein A2Z04_09240 [Chloroflexi bacterium RBG_16_57_9]
MAGAKSDVITHISLLQLPGTQSPKLLVLGRAEGIEVYEKVAAFTLASAWMWTSRYVEVGPPVLNLRYAE